MARPLKEGLTYFPLDVEMDEKVEMIESVHGLEGFALYIKLLQEAYKKHDGRIPINSDGLFSLWKILRKRTELTEETITKIVIDMVTVGLFDKEEYKNGFLTSSGIQKRIKEVNKKRKKDRIYKKNEAVGIQHRKPPDNTSKTPERKEKEIKENEKIKDIPAPKKDSAHPLAIKYFCDKYLEKTKQKYAVMGGKDGQAFKTMLSTHTLEELQKKIDLFFDSTDAYLIRGGYTVGNFLYHINKLYLNGASNGSGTGMQGHTGSKRNAAAVSNGIAAPAGKYGHLG